MEWKMRVKVKIGCWSCVLDIRVWIFISSSIQWGGWYWTGWIQENNNVMVAFPGFLGTVSHKGLSQDSADHTQNDPFPTSINRRPRSRYLNSLIPRRESCSLLVLCRKLWLTDDSNLMTQDLTLCYISTCLREPFGSLWKDPKFWRNSRVLEKGWLILSPLGGISW